MWHKYHWAYRRTSNISKSHQIPNLKCLSSRLAVAFSQSIEARCYVENEDVVAAAPKGDVSTTSEFWVINNFIAY